MSKSIVNNTHVCFCVSTDICPTETNLKLVITTYLRRLKRQYRLKDVDNLVKEMFEIYRYCKHVDLTDICKRVFKLSSQFN